MPTLAQVLSYDKDKQAIELSLSMSERLSLKQITTISQTIQASHLSAIFDAILN
jgi:hypothetical protein